jgi:hypothetical protein
MSPRKTKYGEPTTSVTVRIPESLYARIEGPASEVVVEALAAYLSQDGVRVDRSHQRARIEPPEGVVETDCLHPKNRRVNAIGGKRCLECGKIV